jgi:hypothetical protein
MKLGRFVIVHQGMRIILSLKSLKLKGAKGDIYGTPKDLRVQT